MFHINGIVCRGEIGKIGEFLRGSILSCHSSPSYVRQLSYHKSAPKHITGWWFGTWILFFHILGIIIPMDFHIFQRGRYTTNQIKTNYAEQDFPIFIAPFLSQSTCSYTLQDLFFPTCFLVLHYLHTCLQEFIVQCSFPLVSSFLDILGRFFLILSNVYFFPMCFIKFHTFFPLCFIKFHTWFLVWLG